MSSIGGTIYLGLDVHKDSVTIAVLPEGAIAPTRVERLPNDLAKLRRFCERLGAPGAVRACYTPATRPAAPATCCTARSRVGACTAT